MSIKVIKPLRLSILYRPYRWHAENYLCVTVAALVDLSNPDDPRLLSDIELWRDCMPQMDCEGTLDLVLPKVVPEYLVAGCAYTRFQQDKTQVAVRAQVGDLKKELIVFGDRYWLDATTASEPADFDSMPICWANAYGSTAYARNPMGKGGEVQQRGDDAVSLVPLPNIEGLEDRVAERSGNGKEFGFGPINVLWPQRYQYVGTYSEHWKKHEFPGFFPDMNPLMFNAAPADQHWTQHKHVPAGQTFAFWNMHPEKACWQGRLPDWRVRCFADLSQQGETVAQEISMRATTVWFLPHLEKAVLIYHGTLAVTEHDASDVRKLMPALECAEADELPGSHYVELMRRRADPQMGGQFVDADEQLIPHALHGPLGIDLPDVFRSATWIKSHNRQLQMQSQMRDEFRQNGQNPGEYPFEIMGPPRRYSDADLSAPWQPQSIEEEQQALLQKMDDAYLADVQLSTLSDEDKNKWQMSKPSQFLQSDEAKQASTGQGPPENILLQIQAAQALREDLKAGRINVANMDTLAPGWEVDDEHRAKVADGGFPEGAIQTDMENQADWMQDPAFLLPMERLNALQRQMYLLAVQTQTPVNRLDEPRSRALRQQLLVMQANGDSLQELDLTGAVLAGMNLRDADLSGAWLEGADLHDARFENCMFNATVLARADLTNACFTNCHFDNANLALTLLQNTTFTDCQFKQTVLEDAQILESRFGNCQFTEMLFEKQCFNRCLWEGGLFALSIFDEVDIIGCSLQATRFDKVTFQSSEIQDTKFDEVHVEGCGFIITKLERVLFQASVMKNSAIHYQSQVRQLSFQDSDLSQCFFREMDLRQASFYGSRLSMCDFSLCNLEGTVLKKVDAEKANFSGAHLHKADFTQAHLIEANFTAADMRFANFRQANLFRANFALAHIDDSTVLHGAYVEQANVYPERTEGRVNG